LSSHFAAVAAPYRMLKTRILLVVGSIIVIWLIFLLPKVVVDNESVLDEDAEESPPQTSEVHTQVPPEIQEAIHRLRDQMRERLPKEKNAIFADSLANLYTDAGKFDSAAWFAEEASKFFKTAESWIKAGDQYYQAYTFAVDQADQTRWAAKAQEFFRKVLDENPKNLEVKTKLAMTYLSSSPMQGVLMLREVLAADPTNELALLNMGMLSIQSGQHDKAVERLEELIKINPDHTQGHLLLGIALMNSGEEVRARAQFEKVKQMDKDPAVQATVDSYLKDLK
jgi:tetratricopeptide (TPR) repeat protein